MNYNATDITYPTFQNITLDSNASSYNSSNSTIFNHSAIMRKLNNEFDTFESRSNSRIFMTSVTFEVKVIAERYGIKVVDDASLQQLHHHMNEYLSNSMSKGVFSR